MHKLRRPLYVNEEEAQFLDGVLDLHLEGLAQVNQVVCEDPSITDMDTLLEVSADTNRETDVLQKLKERVRELYRHTG